MGRRPFPGGRAGGARHGLAGIGETFGAAVDAVIRRPLPAVVPLALDAAVFLLALLVASALGASPVGGAVYARARFSFGISSGLPSLADTLDVAAAAAVAQPGLLLVGGAAIVILPLVAFAEAGFVAVVHAAYAQRDDRPLLEVFLPAAQARFLPILLYRALLLLAFLAALLLAAQEGVFRNSAAGALALRFLLVFAPYAIVVDGAGFVEGLKRSVVAVGDHLATCLVLLLFLLLTSGGVAAILSPFVHAYGAPAVLLGVAVYAPLGTALSTFVLLVWLSFRPADLDAEPAPSPSPAGVPA